MKIIFVNLFLIIIFLYSCKTKEKEKETFVEIPIDNSKITDSSNITNQLERVTIIPLKETSGSYMGGIYKLLFVHNKIIAFDRINTNRINLFDSSGYFIKTIIQKGEGPGTAINIVDCWLDEDNNLDVYDFAQMKVFRFDSLFNIADAKKGKMLYHFWNFSNIPKTDKYIGYANFNLYNPPFNGKLYQVAMLNKSLNVANTFMHFDLKFQGINWLSFRQCFFRFHDTLNFFMPRNNFIYSITKDGISKEYKVKYRINPLPDNIRPIIKKHLKEFKVRSMDPNKLASYFNHYARFGGYWIENDNYIYFISKNYSKGNNATHSFLTLINKHTNKVLNTKFLYDTQTYKMKFSLFNTYSTGTNEFVSITNGETLNKMLYNGSPFMGKVINDPEAFYIVKVKFKQR